MSDQIDNTYASIKCLRCGDHIQSKYQHDFHSCECGAISVDGGQAYLRVLGSGDDFETVPATKGNGENA